MLPFFMAAVAAQPSNAVSLWNGCPKSLPTESGTPDAVANAVAHMAGLTPVTE